MVCDIGQDSLMQVVKQVQSGDELAFDDLMPHFAPWIQKTVNRWRLPGVSSEDLWQVAWLGLWQAALQYQPDYGLNFRSWALKIMRRRLAEFARAALRVKHQMLSLALSMDAEGWVEHPTTRHTTTVLSPEDEVIEKETVVARMNALFAGLSAYEVRVARQMIKRIPLSDGAHQLGVGYKSYDNAVQRIRKKAREFLA